MGFPFLERSFLIIDTRGPAAPESDCNQEQDLLAGLPSHPLGCLFSHHRAAHGVSLDLALITALLSFVVLLFFHPPVLCIFQVEKMQNRETGRI